MKNFFWLHDKSIVNAGAIFEFERLRKRVDDKRREMRRVTITSYFSTPLYRRTIIMALVLCLLTNATGYDVIVSYISIILTEHVLTPNEYTMLFGVCEFPTERVNRRMVPVSRLIFSSGAHHDDRYSCIGIHEIE